MIYRNIWLGNTIIIVVIKQICWKQGHVDLAVHSTDIWWDMLIKFSKQIENCLAKIINTKMNSNPCQTAEMELFLQVVTGFRGELRILPYI